jgi:sigma-B regulation protein RsbQ
MNVLLRNNVKVSGQGQTAIIFAHGYGCDQNMWRFVAPSFEKDFQVVLFDYVGAGKSDLPSYDVNRYSSLNGYARDIIEICDALNIKNCVFVGHSVSSMVGVLAANERPDLISKLVLIGPSPSYINRDNYMGGFSQTDIDELLEALDMNYLGWSASMAPAIMGNQDRPELGSELANSFCRTDPSIAKRFARATFLSDNRSDLSKVNVPTLILQCSDDIIAPLVVGDFVHKSIKSSVLVKMKAQGHCPNLSAPEETISEMKKFFGEFCFA